MWIRRLVAPFLVLCFVLGGASVAWAGTDRCSPRCHVVSVRVVTGDANGAWAGTASVSPRFCYDGTNIRAFGVRTAGVAAPGWMYRGAIHVQFYGAVGSPI